MKVIVDDKIPYIKEALRSLADEVLFVPGKEFTSSLVRDADALIIRTRTHCNRELLEGSRVRFIATATIGYDHIDTEYCRRAGITWTNAPGCNAASVAQYVESVFRLLEKEKGKQLSALTLGVIGVGHVGSLVAAVGRRLGMKVLLNDPPRAEKEGGDFSPLSALAEACDVLTFHVPLTRTGALVTFHLADDAFFDSLRRRPVLLNTSRGEVVDNAALLAALRDGKVADAVLDVWEEEPHINRFLLDSVYIGTPHIAGYSADGKANATRMSLDAFCRYFGVEGHYQILPPPPAQPLIRAATEGDACLQMYDPRRDSEALKHAPEQFEQLRGNYPLRREKEAYCVQLIPKNN